MRPVSTGAKVISAQVQGETRRISWFGRPAEPCDQIAIAPVVTIGQARLVSMASTPPTPISWYLRRVLLPSGAPHTHGGTASFWAHCEAKASPSQTRVKGAGAPTTSWVENTRGVGEKEVEVSWPRGTRAARGRGRGKGGTVEEGPCVPRGRYLQPTGTAANSTLDVVNLTNLPWA